MKEDGTPYNIYKDGLKIYTTLDYTMQQYAEAALQHQMESDVQPKMDAQYRRTKTPFVRTSAAAAERIVQNAMRGTDRYRNLKEDGASDADIEKDFRTQVNMRIFTYGGERDTLMTPRDSILHYKRILRASFMAADPTTGHVKAYVGGPDFRYFKYDMVKQGKRQVGSTIKPFVYTFAIDYMGYTPCSMVPNLQTTIETNTGEPWSPKEAGRVEYDGALHPLSWGLANSRNNYSAWIMKQAGQPEAVASFINKMGIHSYIDPVNALALGTADVSLFEMVGAYSTFANRGVFIEPIFVTRIEDRQGNLIASFTPTSSDAISEETAYTMLQMLGDVVLRGTAGRLRRTYGFTDVDMGGKTGTTQESRDTWFMGVTPGLVAGVWVGGEDQQVHLTSGAEGSSIALPIFGEFMTRVYSNPAMSVRRTDKFYRPIGAERYNCREYESMPADSTHITIEDEFFD
jgi:penicillin-binding protein 1A